MSVWARGIFDPQSGQASWPVAALSAACGFAAVTLWLLYLPAIDPDRLDDYGLASLLPVQIWIAFALLSIGFALSLERSVATPVLPFLHIVALVCILHATPAIAYETLRYAWAWKHIGVVDYIQRHGELDQSAQFLAAYHNWPAFLLAAAYVSDLFRLRPVELAELARFTPLVLNLSYAAVLPWIYRRFTTDMRLVWCGVWFFVIGNWVGQDYFSPQGVAYLLYLVLIALCLGPQHTGKGGLRAFSSGGGDRIGRLLDWANRGTPPPSDTTALARVASAVAALLLIAVIAATHQLTPFVVIAALGGLALLGRLSFGFCIFAVLVTATWLLYVATPYMAMVLPELISEVGKTTTAVLGRLVDTSTVSPGQAVVSMASRGLTAALLLLAVAGGLRRLRAGFHDAAAVVLALAPAATIVLTSYGGEVAFRVYFFALPAFAFFAGALFFPSSGSGRTGWTALSIALLGMALIVGFVLANNGKDRQYRFTPAEVAAAVWLYENAPAGALLIEGADNYPYQFMNYERYEYVPITEESEQSIAAILADPAAELGSWLQGWGPVGGYVIITRSQKAYVDDMGVLPRGSLERIERELLKSSRFKLVYATEDGMVFSLNPIGGHTGDWLR